MKTRLSVARELESFGVCREFYIRDLRASGWVNDGESTASVTHHYSTGVGVDADVICVFTEFDRTQRLEVVGAEKCDRPVTAVSNHDDPEAVGDPLWFVQTLDAMDGPLRLKIDNVHGVVAKLGDNEPVLVEVDRHVIDPSGHAFERYRRLKDEGRAPPIRRECRRRRTADKGQISARARNAITSLSTEPEVAARGSMLYIGSNP